MVDACEHPMDLSGEEKEDRRPLWNAFRPSRRVEEERDRESTLRPPLRERDSILLPPECAHFLACAPSPIASTARGISRPRRLRPPPSSSILLSTIHLSLLPNETALIFEGSSRLVETISMNSAGTKPVVLCQICGDVTSNWTVAAECEGVCYRGVSETMLRTLAGPLRDLDLTREERLLGCILTIFADAPPKMTPNVATELAAARDRYLQLLHAHLQRRGWSESALSLRIARLLITSITDIVHLSSDNLILNDVLHIVEYESWTDDLRRHRYKREF